MLKGDKDESISFRIHHGINTLFKWQIHPNKNIYIYQELFFRENIYIYCIVLGKIRRIDCEPVKGLKVEVF